MLRNLFFGFEKTITKLIESIVPVVVPATRHVSLIHS